MEDSAEHTPLELERIWPRLTPTAHKGSAGRVQACVGSQSMPGAALFVARAAQRAGAGLVTVLCVDPGPIISLPSACPEAIWRDVAGSFPSSGASLPRAASAFAEGQPHARVAGCGLGQGERTERILSALIELNDGVPLVLDADALNQAARAPARLKTFAAALVLTPHPKEAGRLLHRELGDSPEERVQAARELAQKTGSVTCLKGAGTVISDGEQVIVNESGSEGMATAGAGDVLAGILAAYLARARSAAPEVRTFEVAALAVRVHGLAGEAAARSQGVDALIASDLIDHLGEVQKALRGQPA